MSIYLKLIPTDQTEEERNHDILSSLYRKKDNAKRYLTSHATEPQLDYIDDLFHESLVVALKRKVDDPTRKDGICLFSGYSTSIRTGFLGAKRFDNDSKLLNELSAVSEIESDPLREAIAREELGHLANAITCGYLFLPAYRRSITIFLLMMTEKYKTLSSIGVDIGLCRERIRQLNNEGAEVIKALFLLFTGEYQTRDNIYYGSHPIFLHRRSLSAFELILDRLPDYRSFLGFYDLTDKHFFYAVGKYIKYFSLEMLHSKHKWICSFLPDSFLYELDIFTQGVAVDEFLDSSDDLFVSLPNTVITIFYHGNEKVLEVGWGREGLYNFEYSDGKGWYNTFIEDEPDYSPDDIVFYSNVKEIMEGTLQDWLSEYLEEEEYVETNKYLEDEFLSFFEE